ncbi:hypothetical protein KO497_02020 [Pacificibacter marinus]|nr:hypothetical protein [Pacificibacter marinus]
MGIYDTEAGVNAYEGDIPQGHPLGMSGLRIAGLACLVLTSGKKSPSTKCIVVRQGIAIALQAILPTSSPNITDLSGPRIVNIAILALNSKGSF